ncbi:hypothetical protein ACPYO6_05180 [Georgenia sp. Z1344]|uniref:hypothetical protein n=1 Tax=Georgenia sp. Z1344 TaxID=3416706 RepID=UPI003CF52BBB
MSVDEIGTDLAALQDYPWWVLVLGVVLVLAAVAWIVLVLVLTSARRERSRADVPLRMADAERERFIAEVEEHYAAYEAGALDLRALHLKLARTMRAFVSERVGRDVRSWTVRDISSHDPTARAGGLLSVWEEPSFAHRSDAEARAARDGAVEVIRRW